MKKWELIIERWDGELYQISLNDLEGWRDSTIPVEDYVPGKQAEAVYFQQILHECSIPWDFSHALFIAQDEFKQEVKKEDLGKAFFVFKQKGEVLGKGFPVRLYVPGNESDCLNVKSVVGVRLLRQ